MHFIFVFGLLLFLNTKYEGKKAGPLNGYTILDINHLPRFFLCLEIIHNVGFGGRYRPSSRTDPENIRYLLLLNTSRN